MKNHGISTVGGHASVHIKTVEISSSKSFVRSRQMTGEFNTVVIVIDRLYAYKQNVMEISDL